VNAPKSLADASVPAARRAALSQPHKAPLVAFVEHLRGRCGQGRRVPDFDPLDGGVHAECLFLLEAPGGRAVASGFVSRDNPDETAKNFFLLNEEAGLTRANTVIWNVVPWYVGTGSRIRAATRADIAAAAPFLDEFLGLLPRLRVVVLSWEEVPARESVARRRLRAVRDLCVSPSKPDVTERAPGASIRDPAMPQRRRGEPGRSFCSKRHSTWMHLSVRPAG
jgi:hypothetical protein